MREKLGIPKTEKKTLLYSVVKLAVTDRGVFHENADVVPDAFVLLALKIAKRVELEEKAYENEEYALFFSDFRSTAATIQFYRLLKEKMAVYSSATKVNANRAGRLTICEADANTIDYPILTGKYSG